MPLIYTSTVFSTKFENSDDLDPAGSSMHSNFKSQSRNNFFSESPKRSTNDTNIYKSVRKSVAKSKSKSIIKTKPKNNQLPIPFITQYFKKKVKGHRIDRSRSKNDIVNCFSLVDKLTKKKQVFV